MIIKLSEDGLPKESWDTASLTVTKYIHFRPSSLSIYSSWVSRLCLKWFLADIRPHSQRNTLVLGCDQQSRSEVPVSGFAQRAWYKSDATIGMHWSFCLAFGVIIESLTPFWWVWVWVCGCHCCLSVLVFFTSTTPILTEFANIKDKLLCRRPACRLWEDMTPRCIWIFT